MEWKSRGTHLRPAAFCPHVPVSRIALLLGDLVLQDILEKNVIDDLTGKHLEAVQVTSAKHEELTELYRRQVWVEKPVGDCFRDTGKPPIPVRWVVTNKGDELHPLQARGQASGRQMWRKGCGGSLGSNASIRINNALAYQGSPGEQLEDDKEEDHVY